MVAETVRCRLGHRHHRGGPLPRHRLDRYGQSRLKQPSCPRRGQEESGGGGYRSGLPGRVWGHRRGDPRGGGLMVRRSPAVGGRRGLPPWAWIVTGLVVVLALVGGVSAWYQGNPRAGEPATTTPAPTAGAAAVPNGCLAGPLNDADGLLQAQKDA